MKIIAINRDIDSHLSLPLSIDIIPDSAIVKDGKPFFVPDFARDAIYQPAIAFRINRLGKNIATRFASRYFDALTIALRITPVSLLNSLRQQQAATALATAFDGSLILGDWTPIPSSHDIAVKLGDNSFRLDYNKFQIDDIIAHVSQYMTLKIGDIIIAGTIPSHSDVELNAHIKAALADIDCLDFRFK